MLDCDLGEHLKLALEALKDSKGMNASLNETLKEQAKKNHRLLKKVEKLLEKKENSDQTDVILQKIDSLAIKTDSTENNRPSEEYETNLEEMKAMFQEQLVIQELEHRKEKEEMRKEMEACKRDADELRNQIGRSTEFLKEVQKHLVDKYMAEQVTIRNYCLYLGNYEIPLEAFFDYSRLASTLVYILQSHSVDQQTQGIAIFLLNSLANRVDSEEKLEIGRLGAIEVIMDKIEIKLAAKICDDTMESSWAFLWEITDESPANCCLFLGAEGLSLFSRCFNTFHGKKELLRNMMGLMGNLAEVDSVRYNLMKTEYINIFLALLDVKDEESMEISYNSAGVLSHLVSDGDEAWSGLRGVSRDNVMQSIMKETDKWNINTKRFINYRSFRPILRLLPLWHAYASQRWAVWALANLTTTVGGKYCFYVIEEGGIPLLEALVSDPRTNPWTRGLAQIVLDNTRDSLHRLRNYPLHPLF